MKHFTHHFQNASLCLILFLGISCATTSAPQNDSLDISGFNAEVIAVIDIAEGKYMALAHALTTEEQWAWRPGEEARSVSEVLMHIAGANYVAPMMVGIMPPDGVDISMGADGFPVGLAELEKITDREEVMATLKASFSHLRNELAQIPSDRMAEPLNLFGNETTVRGFMVFLTAHMHEHLGQLIAYTRANGLVPPWNATDGGPGG